MQTDMTAGAGIEALFTTALGLQPPWEVVQVQLETARRRIDFEVRCSAKRLACPHCGLAEQGIHDRLRRCWRHLDFFQYEAWLHADVPRVACSGCGKTAQAPVAWAREGSGFTALFEALALSLCAQMPVRQALPQAAISYDRFHVLALAGQAMDEVRTSEWRSHPKAVTEVFGDKDSETRKGLMWGMRKNPQGWTARQAAAMHWLQRSHLQSSRAWRMKMSLRQVYARAREHNDSGSAQLELRRWLSWARRSRLKPFVRSGQDHHRTLRWRRAGDAGQPLQRLCGGHERAAAAGQAGGPGLSHSQELHRDCASAHGPAQGFAAKPIQDG